MSTAKLAIVGAFVLGFFAILWYFLPGMVVLINTGSPKEIVINALFPIIAALFCLFMAVRIAMSKESGPYQGDE
ncbi:MAG: hypothetical protein ACR2O4_16935 [Hyphomicrobiaceae bacterium]